MFVTKQMLDDMVRLMAEDRRTLVTPAATTEPIVNNEDMQADDTPEVYTGSYLSPKQPFGDYPVTPQAATVRLVNQMGYPTLCACADLEYAIVQRIYRGHKVRQAEIEKVMKVWKENKRA
jgi:hypothetical protein